MPVSSRVALCFAVLLGWVLMTGPAPTVAQTTAFTYQGYLEESGGPAAGSFDLRFILYDAESGGAQVGDTILKEDVSVTDGVFAIDLDFGTAFDTGALRYLEVAVRDGGSTGSFTVLSPREALRPSPSAIVARRALSLPNVTVNGEGNVGIGTTSPSSPLTVAGAIESTTGGIVFPDGTTQASAGAASGNVWIRGGNSGTDPSTGDYLGTTDNVPFEVQVNSTRASRFEPATDENGNVVPNIIGGHPSNRISNGAYGATIGGGGFSDGTVTAPHEVSGNFSAIGGGIRNTVSGETGFIGGGFSNTSSGTRAVVVGGESNSAGGSRSMVGGGSFNEASGRSATVSGGYQNIASGEEATIAGGDRNRSTTSWATVGGGQLNEATGSVATIGGGGENVASATWSTVGGGNQNTASARQATVAGGGENTASSLYAMVPGGQANEARGDYSFAAGYYARVKSTHDGTFVWSDNSRGPSDSLVSTGSDQFLVRAQGGVGVGTNDPSAQLHTQNNSDSGLTRPAFRAENASPFSGVAGYFITAGTDATVVLANRDGSGPLLKGFGSNGGGRELEIENDGSMSFYDGSNRTVRIDAANGNFNVDGTISSNGADYAELLPQRSASESIDAGDLVGVTGGTITRSTEGADRLMIVSTDPAMLGNKEAEGASPVAFLGQVPVKVRGPVAVGDLLVASGQHDGTARAVAPGAWDPSTDGPIAGQAWTAKPGAGQGTVTAEVGLPQTGALVEQIQKQRAALKAERTKNEAQQAEIDALREEVEALRSIHERLRRLEAALNDSASSTPSSASTRR